MIISSFVVGLKKIDSRKAPDKKFLCEHGGDRISLARVIPEIFKFLLKN